MKTFSLFSWFEIKMLTIRYLDNASILHSKTKLLSTCTSSFHYLLAFFLCCVETSWSGSSLNISWDHFILFCVNAIDEMLLWKKTTIKIWGHRPCLDSFLIQNIVYFRFFIHRYNRNMSLCNLLLVAKKLNEIDISYFSKILAKVYIPKKYW